MNFINKTLIEDEITSELEQHNPNDYKNQHYIGNNKLNSLISSNSKEHRINHKLNFEKKGKQILNKNGFFQDFTTLMKNTTFKNFYGKYFENWSDIETMVFYMKLYDVLEKEYEARYNTTISDELMTYMLHHIITTTEMRKLAISSFNDFKNPSYSHNKLCRVISFHHEKPLPSSKYCEEYEKLLEMEEKKTTKKKSPITIENILCDVNKTSEKPKKSKRNKSTKPIRRIK